MSRLYNFFDIYGDKISFRIQGEPKTRSMSGTGLTFLLLILIVLALISFGHDFFYKTNPIVLYTQMVPEEYEEPVNLSYAQIQLPFRMKNYATGETYNLTGLMEPSVRVTVFKKPNKTSSLEWQRNDFIYVRQCTNEMLPPELLKAISPSKYYCMDFNKSNVTLGGGLDGEFYYFLNIKYRCTSTPITYDHQSESCDYEGLEKAISQASKNLEYTFFEIYYPEYFVTQDYEKPLKIAYKMYEYEISLNTQRNDKFYFQKIKYGDDKGWLVENKEYDEKLSLFSTRTDQTYLDKDMVVNDGWSLYIINFELDKKYIDYSRRFMKIQDLIAQVGGVINGIHKILLLFHVICFGFIQKEILMNSLFLYPIGGASKDIKETENNQIIIMHHQESNAQALPFRSLNTVQMFPKTFSNTKAMPNHQFGFLFSLKYRMRCCLRHVNNKLQHYTQMSKIINERIDICYYLNHLKEFSLLKSILLNPAQKACLEAKKKPLLYNDEEMKLFGYKSTEIEDDQTKLMVDYFTNMIKEKDISQADQQLITMLPEEVIRQLGGQ